MTKGVTPISILIVEDDVSFALELELLVQEIGYRVAGVADSAAAALGIIYADQVDFILMDIDIKGNMTGLELGRKIRPLKIPVLFITSFGNEAHYEEAQKSNLVGYLVKPIDKYTLHTAISLAIGQLYKTSKSKTADQELVDFLFEGYLFLKKETVYYKVAEHDIVLVEGADDYVNIWLNDDRMFVLRKSILTMSRILSTTLFTRVHRSYLVNITAIEHLDAKENYLRAGKFTIPISRQRRVELEKLIRKVE
jgi:DNA-binding LytR/AlgR family response regulator